MVEHTATVEEIAALGSIAFWQGALGRAEVGEEHECVDCSSFCSGGACETGYRVASPVSDKYAETKASSSEYPV